MATNLGTPSDELMKLALGYVESRAVYVAAKLGVADLLDGGAKTARELAPGVDADPQALHRTLRLLARLGLLELDDDARFSLTPRGRSLLGDDAQSMRNYVIFLHEFVHPCIGGLLSAVRTGTPASERIFGVPPFDWIAQDEERAQMFHAGLGNRSRVDTEAILDAYDFSDSGTVVDVGGGNGSLLSAVLARNPAVSAILLERGHAVEAARQGLGGPLPRCELVVGDFFEAVPAGGDIYMMKLVLHDWPDDRAETIMRNCRAAMEAGKRLLVIEGVIEPDGEATFTDLMDLVMLSMYHGRERSRDEFARLFDRTGFRLNRVLPTSASLYLIEAVAV